VFERHNVTFVSVTQQFNTTTSMGRLTLNILLSFAQFEREVIGERIRDKFAASRKKGMWMGGWPPLGYEVENRRLAVAEREAALARRIFDRFAKTGSALTVARDLNAAGEVTKQRPGADGARGGKLWTKGAVYRVLANRIYLGEAVHKGIAYPGEHAAIIDRRTWEKAHAVMAEPAHRRGAATRAEIPALLKGLIYGPNGRPMSPSHTRRRGRIYTYYVTREAIADGYDSCPATSVPAADVEGAVLDHIQKLLAAPELVARTWAMARREDHEIAEREVTVLLTETSPRSGTSCSRPSKRASSSCSSSGWMFRRRRSRCGSGPRDWRAWSVNCGMAKSRRRGRRDVRRPDPARRNNAGRPDSDEFPAPRRPQADRGARR
jgi:site-specific DNA recombinase